MKRILIIILIAILYTTINAQTESIRVLANVKKDRIQIRWAPTSYDFWQIGNKNGYKVEKFIISSGNSFDTGSYQKPIVMIESSKPLPKNMWTETVKKEPKAQIVQSMLYEAPNLPPKSPSQDLKGFLNYTKVQNNRFGFALFACDMSTTIAKAHGLYIEDTKVKTGEKYAYRISLKAKHGKKDTIYTTSILVGLEDYFDLPKPKDIQVESGEKTALLSWNIEYDKGLYTGYFIEKSSDGKKFERINEAPYVQMKTEKNIETKRYYFEDSIIDAKTIYYYRIVGMTPFGELSPESDIVKVKSKSPLQVVIGIDTSGLTKDNKCFFNWYIAGSDTDKIKQYNILRTTSSGGIFEKIASVNKNERTYIDNNPLRNNYYIVEAQGEEDMSNHSVSVLVIPIDSTPPAIPEGLKAKVDQNGIVYLTWNPNLEEDIYGYRVYRVNDQKEEPVEVTKVLLNANLFIDTLKLDILSKKVYYFVTAVDINYNPSEYSDSIMVKRPDTIPPAPAQIIEARQDKYKIYVKWQKSYSVDVEKYFLYRMNLLNQKKELMDSFDFDETIFSYTDSLYDIGEKYKYITEVWDDSKNVSVAQSGIINTETGIRRAMKSLKIKLEAEEKKVKISWKYEGKEKVESFAIYRQKNKEPIQTLEVLEPSELSFEDSKILLGNEYSYCIKANLEKNLETELSKKITVKY